MKLLTQIKKPHKFLTYKALSELGELGFEPKTYALKVRCSTC